MGSCAEDKVGGGGSGESCHDHEPLQLIKFNKTDTEGNTAIQINDECLDKIINQAGDRPLCVICICGPSRQGKSFVLGYMIRCLEALEKDEPDWMDWDNKTKPLTGFKFRNGTTPETQGIWIWSKPFIVKTDDGNEVAVLLIDTQGTQDEFTTGKDMSAIVGLSLLTSSVLIFNFFTNLQEDTLLALNTYVQYGLLALENSKEREIPFQKLTFLIRDWNNPGEFTYGGKGGKQFLDKKLETKAGQPPEAIEIRETIRKCFQELDCFLMPSIGEKALLPAFTGSLAELNPQFAKKLEDFISNLISNETLTLKKILGNSISAGELKKFLQTYVEIFNSSEMPTAAFMYQATCEASISNVVNKALKKYNESMKKKLRGNSYVSEEELKKAHEFGTKQALDLYRKGKKFGNEEKIAEHEESLENQMKKEFVEMKKQNEDKRTKYLTNATHEALTSFRNMLQENIHLSDEDEDSTKFYEDNIISREVDQAKSQSVEDFEAKITQEDDEKTKIHIEQLERMMETFISSYVNLNKVHRSNAEKCMESILNDAMEKYSTHLEEYLNENKFAEMEEFHEIRESITKEVMEDFSKQNKPGNKNFQNEFKEKLERDLNKIYENLETRHKAEIQELQIRAEAAIREICEEYESSLRELAERMESPEQDELESTHLKHLSVIMEDFQSDKNVFPTESSLFSKLNQSLTDGLDKAFESMMQNVINSKERCEASFREAIEEGFNYYVESMEGILHDDFMADEDLQVESDTFFQEAIEKFEDYPKVGFSENALDYKQELKEKLDTRRDKFMEDNEQRRSFAFSKAINLFNECNTKYQHLMKQDIERVRTAEELEESHTKAKGFAVDSFDETCPVRYPAFRLEQMDKLKLEIDEAFTELKELFELKRSEEATATKGILVDARKYYHDEMEKHFKNNLFINPFELDEMHRTTLQGAISKCEQQGPLSSFQRMDIEQELTILLEQYQSKNDMNLNSESGAPAIGIDLGTTYCCVAVYYKGKVIIIPNHEQGDNKTTPSYVAFNEDGSETIGHPAKDNAYRNPENTIYDAKRILGRRMDDPNLQSDMKYWPFTIVEEDGIPKIDIQGGSSLHPEQISAKLLVELRVMAEKHLKLAPGSITKAVITVPAYFTDGQRQATVDAGELASLEVLTIINEPTAAAIAYSLERLDTDARKVLIFDLGGGTFDVAVLDMKPGKIDVLGVEGDTHLGGEDFDKNLMEYCALEFQVEEGINILEGKDSPVGPVRDEARRRMRRLQTHCEKSKKELASATFTEVCVDAMADGLDLNVKVTREKFEELNEAHFKNAIDIVDRALRKTRVNKEAIDDIVLIGGSTRIPKVQEMLKDYFNGKALTYSVNPDEAVAYGAAIHAAQLNGNQAKGEIDFSQIQDVTSLSLGIEVVTKELSVIIPSGTKIPTRLKEDYRTAHDNQTSCRIKIYQGEEYIAANNKLLGEFDLEGIPSAKAGREALDVWMEVNSMGILHVEAICKSNRGSNSITVTENKQRMGRETIRRILEEAQPA